jgi:hypothetical protein
VKNQEHKAEGKLERKEELNREVRKKVRERDLIITLERKAILLGHVGRT